jgi:NAD(P)-dependent dehydrogenase (short-subunit alcohol dehydrogenase family)
MTVLAPKVVLVTGAGRGIGRALAHAFAHEGYRVVVASRNENKLQIVAEEIGRAGGQALARRCDITEKAQVEELERQIRGQFGTVQVLVNNAGMAEAAGFLEMADRLWEETLRVNMTGTYNCCKMFLPGMIERKWGRIINIASTTAKVAYSHVSAYTSSKHGLVGLTRSLALETARLGVTVNAICPGYVDTERTRENAQRMADKSGKNVEEVLRLFAQSSPQHRLIAPEEVAALALMLASESAGGITGQAIHVDGGAVMA